MGKAGLIRWVLLTLVYITTFTRVTSNSDPSTYTATDSPVTFASPSSSASPSWAHSASISASSTNSRSSSASITSHPTVTLTPSVTSSRSRSGSITRSPSSSKSRTPTRTRSSLSSTPSTSRSRTPTATTLTTYAGCNLFPPSSIRKDSIAAWYANPNKANLQDCASACSTDRTKCITFWFYDDSDPYHGACYLAQRIAEGPVMVAINVEDNRGRWVGVCNGTAYQVIPPSPSTSASTSRTPTSSYSPSMTTSVTASRTMSGSITGSSSVSPSQTETPPASASATSSGTDSPSGSCSATRTSSVSPTPSWSASLTPSTSPGAQIYGASLILLSSGGSLYGEALPVGKLNVTGRQLGLFCASTSVLRTILQTWTNATLIDVSMCSENIVQLTVNITEDPIPWFWVQRSLRIVAMGMIQTVPVPLLPTTTRVSTTQLLWRRDVVVHGPGLGVAGVRRVEFLSSGADKGPPAICGMIRQSTTCSITCKLLTAPEDMIGRPLNVSFIFDAGLVSIPHVVVANETEGSALPLITAPSVRTVRVPDLIQPAGNDLLEFTFDFEVWSPAEHNSLDDLSIWLLVGGWKAPCYFADNGLSAPHAHIVCPSPAGWGVELEAKLAVQMMTNVSVGHMTYGPPTIVAFSPREVWLPPVEKSQSLGFSITFQESVFIEFLLNVQIANVTCISQFYSLMDKTLYCNISSAAIHMQFVNEASDSAPPNVPLDLSYSWASHRIRVLDVATAISRPVLTSTAPELVMFGGVLIIFGKNFCGSGPCSAVTVPKLTVMIGKASCTDVLQILDTVAMCYVPNMDIEMSGYPTFFVSLRNAVFAESVELVSVSYPATAIVRASTALPATFLPSDESSPAFTNLPIQVWVSTVTGNTTNAYTMPIGCTLRTTTPSVLLFPKAPFLNTLVNVLSSPEGIVNFGHIGVQATFGVKSVTLQISCAAKQVGDITSISPLLHTLHLTELVITWCKAPPRRIQVQGVMEPWWIVVSSPANVGTACADGTRRGSAVPLPQIVCTASASTVGGAMPVLQGNIAVMDPDTFTATFTAMSLMGRPETDYQLTVRCAVGSIYIPSVNGSATVRLTGCAPGFEAVGSSCAPCPANFYSYGGNDTCTSCPQKGARCSSGTLTLLGGYFRPPSQLNERLNADAELYTCAVPGGCFVDVVNGTHGCNEGYTGPLCGVCDQDNGYSLIMNKCVKCLPRTLNQGIIALVIILICLVVGAFMLRRSEGKRSNGSIALRILLTHIQAIGSIQAFRLPGTEAYKQFMSWTEALSPAVLSQGPTQCLMKPSFKTVLFSTILAPAIAYFAGLFMLAILVLGHGYRAWRRGQDPLGPLRQRLRQRRHLAILFFVCHLAYMPIVSTALSVFNCTPPVAGIRYLVRDLREPCTGGSYLLLAVFSAIVLLLYGLGLPLALFLMLRKASQRTLHDEHFHSAFGFLYDGYRAGPSAESTDGTRTTELRRNVNAPPGNGLPLNEPFDGDFARGAPKPKEGLSNLATHNSTCGMFKRLSSCGSTSLVWWEAVVLLRKAGIVLIGGLVSDPLTQIGLCIIWNQVLLVAHVKYDPYTSKTFYITEALSLLVISITAALAVISASAGGGSSQDRLVSAVMIVVNIMALLVLGYTLFKAYVQDYRNHMRKVVKLFGNRARRNLVKEPPADPTSTAPGVFVIHNSYQRRKKEGEGTMATKNTPEVGCIPTQSAGFSTLIPFRSMNVLASSSRRLIPPSSSRLNPAFDGTTAYESKV